MDWIEVTYFGCTLLFSLYIMICFLIGVVVGHFLIGRIKG